MTAKTERIALWDNLKFFLITMVAIGHIIDNFTYDSKFILGLFLFIYSFHMPAFIFVSGIFAKKTIRDRNVTKALPYLTMFFVSMLLYFLYGAIFEKAYVVSFFKMMSLPWFMFAIFAMYLITMVTQKYKPAFILTISVLLALVAGYSMEDGNWFCWMRIVNFYPFFYMGYLLEPKKVEAVVCKKKVKITAIVLLVAIFCLYVRFGSRLDCFRSALFGALPYTRLGDYGQMGWLVRLVLYLISFAIIFLLVAAVPTKKTVFSVLGERTLAIYATHNIVIKIFWHYVTKEQFLAVFSYGWQLALIVLGILITLLCSNRWFDKFFKWLMAYDWKLR